MTFRTRFAPSPTGPLHLGHAYSAMLAHDMARKHNGAFLLRIEDIDKSRSRPEWENLIYEDLNWLGVTWDEPVLRQSDRMAEYDKALRELWAKGLLFSCNCSRRDITQAMSAPQEGASGFGPDGPIYPGTCRHNAPVHNKVLMAENRALRLSMASAVAAISTDAGVSFEECVHKGHHTETFTSDTLIKTVGDVVLARKSMATSYHLSVVLDDAFQGITDVVRGEDLFEATQIHVVLQGLLGLVTPRYHHHALIRDAAGKRLAKRDDARAVSTYRNDGASPADIRRLVGLAG